jgi:hypothetical protein
MCHKALLWITQQFYYIVAGVMFHNLLLWQTQYLFHCCWWHVITYCCGTLSSCISLLLVSCAITHCCGTLSVFIVAGGMCHKALLWHTECF